MEEKKTAVDEGQAGQPCTRRGLAVWRVTYMHGTGGFHEGTAASNTPEHPYETSQKKGWEEGEWQRATPVFPPLQAKKGRRMKTGMKDGAENRKITVPRMEGAVDDRRDCIGDGVMELTGRGCPCMIYHWLIATALFPFDSNCTVRYIPHRFVDGRSETWSRGRTEGRGQSNERAPDVRITSSPGRPPAHTGWCRL